MNEDDLRRLLADARHDEPVPDDVAARLDAVLAGLADEGPVPRPRVVDLAARRRRRRAGTLLVAAAAVVAVGVGLGRLDLTRSTGDADGGSSESAADSAGIAAAEAPSAATGPVTDRVEVAERPVRVDDQDFSAVAAEKARDLRSPAAASDLSSTTEGYLDLDRSDGAAASAGWFACEKAPFGRGRLVAVEYRGASAVLAVRPPTGDSVVVELLQCGTATVLRSATVPLP